MNDKIISLEDKSLNNDINSSTYQSWPKKLKEEKSILEYELKPRSKIVQDDDEIVLRILPNLSNLFGIYDKCNVTQKHAIVRGVFKDNLVNAGGQFRTNYIDPTFHHNVLNTNEKGLLFYEQSFQKLNEKSLSTREQIRTATPLPAPAPQAGASTNFATRVGFCCKYIFIRNSFDT